MQKIFITGITGQDGLFLTSKLLNKKVSIYGSTRQSSTKNFYNKLAKINNLSGAEVKLINLDLLNYQTVETFLNDVKPDKIFNLTGPSSVYKSITDNQESYNQIINIFDNLTTSVLKNRLKTVIFQASSSEMFEKNKEGIYDESSKLSASTPYAEAKIHNHLKSVELSSKYNLNIYSGIMFNHESEFRANDYLIMQVIAAAEKIACGKLNQFSIGSLDLVRDWSFAGDIVDAMIKISDNGKFNSYVIGSGQGASISYVIKLVFEYFNLDFNEFIKVDKNLNRKNNNKKIISNPTRIKNELNWQTTLSLDELIVRCIEKRPINLE
jgi:GDPmannose 4,6-dehydratase